MAQQDYNDWFDNEFAVGTTKEQREAVNMYGYDAVFDEQGNVLKRVTSGDSGEIEDPEKQGGNQGGNTSGGGNTRVDDDNSGMDQN